MGASTWESWLPGIAIGGLFLAVFVANVVTAALEMWRACRVAADLKTGVRRASGWDALKLVPLVGGGGGLWQAITGVDCGDAGDACDDGGDC
jgi:hypothetical protein